MTSQRCAPSVTRTKAGRLREIHVVERLLQLGREQLGELVLEALALFIRERQVARIGADPEHLGIDKLDREIEPFIVGLCARTIVTDKHCDDREKRNCQAAW